MPKDGEQLRCSNRIFGIFQSENRLEVKCGSRNCGAGKGVIVLHIFDLNTGKLTSTKKYREPNTRKESRHGVE